MSFKQLFFKRVILPFLLMLPKINTQTNTNLQSDFSETEINKFVTLIQYLGKLSSQVQMELNVYSSVIQSEPQITSGVNDGVNYTTFEQEIYPHIILTMRVQGLMSITLYFYIIDGEYQIALTARYGDYPHDELQEVEASNTYRELFGTQTYDTDLFIIMVIGEDEITYPTQINLYPFGIDLVKIISELITMYLEKISSVQNDYRVYVFPGEMEKNQVFVS